MLSNNCSKSLTCIHKILNYALYDRAGDKGIELSTSGAFIIYCDQMFLQFLFLDFLLWIFIPDWM